MSKSMKTITAIPSSASRTAVKIPAGYVELDGELKLPDDAPGVVLLTPGNGSSRHNLHDQYLAEMIRESGLGTLQFDLLTHKEMQQDASTNALRVDIDLLAQRLIGVTHWLEKQKATRGLKLGYFGASTGGAATLIAAAALGERIAAVVSQGGRPDLAGNVLHLIRSPTLFVVGGYDDLVLCWNDEAYGKLCCKKEFRVIPCATHHFEEPGKLEQVAQLSSHWFSRHMGTATDWKDAA
jgi:putative phosphoribosyl transferase